MELEISLETRSSIHFWTMKYDLWEKNFEIHLTKKLAQFWLVLFLNSLLISEVKTSLKITYIFGK